MPTKKFGLTSSRILTNPPPPPRGLGGNPERKMLLVFFDLAGVKFLLKKERVFSFGVLPSKYSGSVAGLILLAGKNGGGYGGNSAVFLLSKIACRRITIEKIRKNL